MADRLGTDMVRARPLGYSLPAPIEGSTTIDANTLVGVIASTGYVEPYDESVTYNFVAVATQPIVNSGADGAVEVKGRELMYNVMLKMDCAGMAIDDLGKAVYASDDRTCTLTPSTNTHKIGHIVEFVSATEVYVLIDGLIR